MKKRLFKGHIENRLTLTFHKVREDIRLLKEWILHLNSKHEDLDNYKEGLTLTNDEVKNLGLWVGYLERRYNDLSEHTKSVHNYILDLHKNDKEIFDRLKSLENVQGQVGTIEGTNKGQIGDKSSFEENKGEVQKSVIIDKDRLSGAQIEVLNILYNYDKPLGYDRIAKILGKKEKSIRNLIYELRIKGINIKSRPVGVRQKGFYLEHEDKIRVSGR